MDIAIVRCTACRLVILCVTLWVCVNPASPATQSPQPNPASQPIKGYAILTQPVKIKIAYGETVLPAGMKLPVISTDATTVRVSYMGEAQTIPINAVKLELADPEPSNKSSPTPSAPPPLPQPSASRTRTIYLRQGYDSRMQGGDITMRELQSLLSPHCSAEIDISGEGIEIYHGVRYLMDVAEAAKILNLRGVPSRAQLATPGFPRSSMYYVAYDGTFEGHFNRLYFVTDAANNVTSVQLVDEHPKSPPEHFSRDSENSWYTYNFVNTRLRASESARVIPQSKRDRDLIRIETRMYQGFRKQSGHFISHPYQEMENTKLLIPIPFARIILHCIDAGLSKS